MYRIHLDKTCLHTKLIWYWLVIVNDRGRLTEQFFNWYHNAGLHRNVNTNYAIVNIITVRYYITLKTAHRR